jgi:hypothetical protein
VKVFTGVVPANEVLHLRELAGCFGIDAELVGVSDGNALLRTIGEREGQALMGAVLDITDLAGLCSPVELEQLGAMLRASDRPILCLIREPSPAADRFLQCLSNGQIMGAVSTDLVDRVVFSDSGRDIIGELSTHSYPRRRPKALGLVMADGAASGIVMSVGLTPSFVRVRAGQATVFGWSTTRICDVFRPLTAEIEFEEAADEYVPLIAFLRFSFGEACWHNPMVAADMIIDDPLLSKRYGYINFPQLLASARRHSYHVTLAFIPWNYWRSRSHDVRLFLDYADCFSICAHGCDHTRNEFESEDYDLLLRKSLVAAERMERHRHRTGISCDPIMVCPQERYSIEGMRALADSRQFIGISNTACIARNLSVPQVCAADLLLPAQDSFFGLPIFKRHYRNEIAAFAMGLFLGKPAILAEHHEFFENGTAGVEEFVAQLVAMRADVTWASMVKIATTTHVQRRLSRDRRALRFFTDRFEFLHATEEATEYRVVRRMPGNVPTGAVLVDGRPVRFSKDNNQLTFEIRVDEPRTVRIDVVIPSAVSTKAYPRGGRYQASVALRRGLSELRDNLFAKDQRALKVARALMKAMKQTGG